MTRTTPRLGLVVYDHWSEAPWDAARWPDFSPQELACRGTGRLAYHAPTLDKLQALRTALGRPVMLTSAYRSPEHNEAVGGARASWHKEGVAFDVMMTNHDPRAFEAAARAAGFGSVGRYPDRSFIHIDTRTDFGAPAWDGGPQFPVDAAPFSTPEPVPRPVATPTGRAGVAATAGGTAVGGVVLAREVAPTLEAAQGLPQSVQLALVGAVALLALALIAWGPDGIRAALRRLRRDGDDL
ncbi:D-Ala-D-Ala carboxypeptidase family metallohydrolase [Roseicyclus amphidinii]|uniref:D-Ala-D-Ala carboxypeptidase family metallohydrolase n=1 Tax=Roseicyclus amphidinii TaxID=3034232 RepID=UPI0024E17D87|nr:D-Ala-D-Ala carboxypeptidase family metallohydrolase [Roseicyclus sp. Amp-Y-6]